VQVDADHELAFAGLYFASAIRSASQDVVRQRDDYAALMGRALTVAGRLDVDPRTRLSVIAVAVLHSDVLVERHRAPSQTCCGRQGPSGRRIRVRRQDSLQFLQFLFERLDARFEPADSVDWPASAVPPHDSSSAGTDSIAPENKCMYRSHADPGARQRHQRTSSRINASSVVDGGAVGNSCRRPPLS
jgi:hypothetical protein